MVARIWLTRPSTRWIWRPGRLSPSRSTEPMKETRRPFRRRWLKQVSAKGPREVVTDKGYHSRAVVSELTTWGVRTYCSEPNRGRQRWSKQGREQEAVYANRRRIRGERGLRLLRQRGEKLERWNQ